MKSFLLTTFLAFTTFGFSQIKLLDAANAGQKTELILTVNFSANNYTICPGEFVQFTDLTSGAPSTWTWSFSGGTSAGSNLQNPLVQYNLPGSYNVLLSASNGTDQATLGKLGFIKVIACTDISDFKNNATLSFYPNPVSENLTVSSNQSTEYFISDIYGKTILSGKLSADTPTQIQVDQLSAGIYFISTISGGTVSSSKFLKQ